MTPHRARFLLALTVAGLAGYCLRWFLAAWGWTPIICLAVVAVAAFAAGAGVTAQAFADQTAKANRERDDADKNDPALDPKHPAVRSKLHAVPGQQR
jgi:hypothetical protein